MQQQEHLLITNFNGNPNVGLYGYCNDEFCLIGNEINKKICNKIEQILKVPVHRLNLAGTSLVGVFCVGNKNSIILPSIVFDDELKILEKSGIKFEVIDTELTAFGNNILANNKAALVNPFFDDSTIKQIKRALKVDVEKATIAELDNVGSLAVLNKNNCLISRGVKDSELKIVEKTLGVKCTLGTISFGLPYISAGILANSNGIVISEQSTGIEITDADHALGFI